MVRRSAWPVAAGAGTGGAGVGRRCPAPVAAARAARTLLGAAGPGLGQHGRDQGHVVVALALDGRRPQGGGRVIHGEDGGVAGAGRGSAMRVVPCAWEIRAPGMNRPIE